MKLLHIPSWSLALASIIISEAPWYVHAHKKYYIIDTCNQDLCWRVEGKGKEIEPGAKIVLAKCDRNDDRQLFDINYYDYVADVLFSDFHPKLNEDLVIGVNELADHKRLRVQKPKANNITQVFYFDEHGQMGMGTDENCMWEFHGYYDPLGMFGHCLVVSNQGNNAAAGNIVHLKTYAEILNKTKADINIWWLKSVLLGDYDGYDDYGN